MKRVLLLAALCMAMALVFAPMAMAQDNLNCADLSEAEEQAVFAADPSDPNGLDENDNGVPCEDDDTDNGSFALPEEVTMMEEPTSVEPTTVEPTSVEPTMMEETTMMVTASPQSDEESAPSPTSAEPDEASPLPDTGGVFSPAFLSVAAAILLVGGGIASASIMRRR